MDGVLIINKEKGYTSFDAVARLRSILQQRKLGHTGTLDPEAEGVLPVCLGRATKLAELISEGTKVYRCILYLGVTTDTQDASGRVLCRGEVPSDEALIRRTVESFAGEQLQLTPMYSARKVDGRKLVDLARQGQEVEREAKPVTVYQIDILGMELPRLTLRIRCSKGTYIRTLCNDIGDALGCGGMMERLIREETGGFRLEQARTLSTLEALKLTGGLEKVLIPMEQLLDPYPRFRLKSAYEKAGRNGNLLKVIWGSFSRRPEAQEPVQVLAADGSLLGLYKENRPGELKPYIMLLPETEKPPIRRSPRPSVISIGKFDGMHRGHQLIFGKMDELAREQNLRKCLFSFSMSPQAVLEGRKQENLFSASEKKYMGRRLGIDLMTEYPFTDEIRHMEAERFLTDILMGQLGMKQIVVGPDCAFGFERRGNIEFLRERAPELGFGLTVVEKLQLDGDVVSSSRIRRLLSEGRMEEANRCLGYDYFFEGRIGYGRHLGSSIGIPTANQTVPPAKCLPPFGVYVSMLETEDGTLYPAISNLGVKPTVEGERAPGLETHILEGSPELYGLPVRTALLKYLRPEQRFAGLDALKNAIASDIQNAKKWFTENQSQ